MTQSSRNLDIARDIFGRAFRDVFGNVPPRVPTVDRLTAADVRRIFNVAPQTLGGWIRRGCPSDGRGRGRSFNVAAVAAWMLATWPKGRRAGPTGPTGPRGPRRGHQ